MNKDLIIQKYKEQSAAYEKYCMALLDGFNNDMGGVSYPIKEEEELQRITKELASLESSQKEPAEVSEEIIKKVISVYLLHKNESWEYINSEIDKILNCNKCREECQSLPQSQKTESAEDFYEKHFNCKYFPNHSTINASLIRFAEEYAQSHQVSQEARPTDRELLIRYDKFMSSHDFNGRLLSPEQAVDEFLKQK
jgi:uncharacterized protein YifE (UPF0438 family)